MEDRVGEGAGYPLRVGSSGGELEVDHFPVESGRRSSSNPRWLGYRAGPMFPKTSESVYANADKYVVGVVGSPDHQRGCRSDHTT